MVKGSECWNGFNKDNHSQEDMMKDKRRFLKIQALHAMGQAVEAAYQVLESERVAGVAGEELSCVEDHVEKMEMLYEECIQCCIEDISKEGN
jgi:hypothetical protein